MKIKHLLILIILAAVLAGWAYWSSLDTGQSVSILVGTKVLGDLPVNDVSRIVITSPGSTVIVAKAEGTWSVPSRYNYPADFDKIADTIREISELTIGQVVNVSKDQWGNLNLLSPSRPSDKTASEQGDAGSLLELKDNQDRLLASLIIGKPFMRRPAQKAMGPMTDLGGYPDGQYVRRNDDTVFLVSKTLERLTEDVKTWLDDEFIDVTASDIQEITVTGPDRAPIKLKLEGDNQLTLEGVRDDEESVETSKINQMAGALRYLSFDDIASPVLTPEQAGMDQPVIFTARTKQGQIFTLRIGSDITNAPPTRFVRVSVAYEAPTPDTKPADEQSSDAAIGTSTTDEEKDSLAKDQQLAEKTRALNDKLSRWTYMVKPYRADPLLLKREDMVKKKEPAEEKKSGPETTPDEPDASSATPIAAVPFCWLPNSGAGSPRSRRRIATSGHLFPEGATWKTARQKTAATRPTDCQFSISG